MKSSSNRPAIPSSHTALARILKEQGLKGEVKAAPFSSLIYHLKPGDTVLATMEDGTQRPLKISSVRHAGRNAIVSLHEIADRDAASALRDAILSASGESFPPLPDGEYFHEQIIGMTVQTVGGIDLGHITDIFPTGSNDVYVVENNGRQYLIPAIRDVIRSIDLERSLMIIDPMEGLLD